MTSEEAIARARARWAEAQPDPLDVEERIAIRYEDGPAPSVRVLEVGGGVEGAPRAVRIFRETGRAEKATGNPATVSAYVRRWDDTDAVLDRLAVAAGDRDADPHGLTPSHSTCRP
ncbi:MAG: hypothetical protein RID81_07275 [Sandaracinaceae bacterium]